MRVTLKQILDELKTFVNGHYQLYTYGSGLISEISTKNTEYPLLWVSAAPSRINGSEMILSLDIYVLDLEAQDKSNLEDILNETLLIGNDLINKYFETATIDNEYDLWSIGTVTMEPFTFKFDDVLSGWRFELDLSIDNGNNCELPIA